MAVITLVPIYRGGLDAWIRGIKDDPQALQMVVAFWGFARPVPAARVRRNQTTGAWEIIP